MNNPFSRYPFVALGLVLVLSLAGCNSMSKKHDYPTTVARFFLEAADGDGFASAVLPISGVRIAIGNKAVITELDIVHVELCSSDMGRYLAFQLTPAAGRDLYRLTGSHQGSRLVLAINDIALGARLIDRPFDGGYIAVFVELPDDQLAELVKNLNATSVDIQKEVAKK